MSQQAMPTCGRLPYVPGQLRNHLGTFKRWKLCCGRWPTRAGGRCWTRWPVARPRPGNWPGCCRSPAPACRGTCGCCARRGWSRSGRTRSGGCTASGPSRWPRSTTGSAGTGPCGNNAWTPCTPRSPAENENEEQLMTERRILGSLRTADGAGVVRIEDRYDTGIDDLWAAITDPDRVARWYGRVDGDLRLGGQFHLFVDGSEWDGTGVVEACEPPRHLQVRTQEAAEPYEEVIEATLTADGDQTVLVIEARGMPLDKVAFYGAGWQMHAEDLAAYLAGRDRADAGKRFGELVPSYQQQAAGLA